MKLLDRKSHYHLGQSNKQQYIDEMYQFHQLLFDYSELLKDTDIASIRIQDDGVVFTSREQGINIWFNQQDKRSIPFEILNFNFHEPAESYLIFELISTLDASCNIFDIGANIGWYSLNIAKQFNQAKVWSFEPVKSTFEYFRKNLELNSEIENIIVYNFGFSNQNETLKFYVQPDTSVTASLVNITESETIKEITCEVKRLDEFIDEHPVKIDFIKCDVEGAELLVYQGGLETIKRDKPIIFTEMLRKWSAKFNYHPNQIIDLMAEIGYDCFTVCDHNLSRFFLMDDTTLETNFFFLHREKHSQQIQKFMLRKTHL
ncbi:FkbM family methyltransferase [Microcystis aeruginosa CS-558/01A06]|uniref:FkbM family methyltransferase n=1 Tax=Microcystis aeruginosa BLCC-F108 TaxID=2755317 RepID=A0A841UMS4_MICAE|nr:MULTISPECIES: FkbM family methyltransferase [Microcystis]MBC1189929.1 FkbM family methyltransferase [Microcystis aeruginosa BLCC-F108]MCA2591968.1 FkbM family methyltransferase [Microcystis sp. M31BS1]MDB9409813.1 FkbM family methyltransferase [Microcystis aeruginosa CS-558/01A06]